MWAITTFPHHVSAVLDPPLAPAAPRWFPIIATHSPTPPPGPMDPAVTAGPTIGSSLCLYTRARRRALLYTMTCSRLPRSRSLAIITCSKANVFSCSISPPPPSDSQPTPSVHGNRRRAAQGPWRRGHGNCRVGWYLQALACNIDDVVCRARLPSSIQPCSCGAIPNDAIITIHASY